jgi:prevent-host-death family protein
MATNVKNGRKAEASSRAKAEIVAETDTKYGPDRSQLPEEWEMPDADEHMTVSQLRADLANALNRVGYGKERIIIERQGKPLAVLMPMQDLEVLEELEDRWLAAEAEKAMAEGGETIPWEEIKREHGW